MSSIQPPRRQVLCGLAAAVALPAGIAGLAACSSDEPASGPAGGPSGGPAASGGGGAGGASSSAPAATPNGTPLAQVPVGGGVVVDGASGPVVIVQPTAGAVRAFSAVCPHQGATVNAPRSGTIRCPRHGSQFDASTGALKKGPADTGLPEVPSRVENGTVVLS